MTSPNKPAWNASQWSISTANCTISLTGNAGGLMCWTVAAVNVLRPLAAGQFQSSGNSQQDLKTAQAAAVAGLNDYVKTIQSYSAEVAAL